jgi:hypothetical protein
MNTLSVGTFIPNFKIKDLRLDSNVNRDTNVSNIEEKKDKLEQNGWIMPIVVTPLGKVLEGQNRLEAAISLNLKSMPVYIVDWIDDNDVDEVRDIIISLNNGNRAWTQWDYIKSYKATNKEYAAAYANCIKYGETLSNGVVVAAMFGIGSANSRFKKGGSELKSREKYEYLLETCKSLVNTYGKNQFPSQTLRSFLLWAGNKEFKLINYIVNEMKTSVRNGVRVADGDLGLKEWLKEKEDTYASFSN